MKKPLAFKNPFLIALWSFFLPLILPVARAATEPFRLFTCVAEGIQDATSDSSGIYKISPAEAAEFEIYESARVDDAVFVTARFSYRDWNLEPASGAYGPLEATRISRMPGRVRTYLAGTASPGFAGPSPVGHSLVGKFHLPDTNLAQLPNRFPLSVELSFANIAEGNNPAKMRGFRKNYYGMCTGQPISQETFEAAQRNAQVEGVSNASDSSRLNFSAGDQGLADRGSVFVPQPGSFILGVGPGLEATGISTSTDAGLVHKVDTAQQLLKSTLTPKVVGTAVVVAVGIIALRRALQENPYTASIANVLVMTLPSNQPITVPVDPKFTMADLVKFANSSTADGIVMRKNEEFAIYVDSAVKSIQWQLACREVGCI